MITFVIRNYQNLEKCVQLWQTFTKRTGLEKILFTSITKTCAWEVNVPIKTFHINSHALSNLQKRYTECNVSLLDLHQANTIW